MATKYPDYLSAFRTKDGYLKNEFKSSVLLEILKKNINGNMKTDLMTATLEANLIDYWDDESDTYVLYQKKKIVKEEGKQYPRTKVTYFFALINEKSQLMHEKQIKSTGQNVHFYIRNKMSPIRYIIEKEGL